MRGSRKFQAMFYLPILFALGKILLGLQLELGNDEVYYYTYAQKIGLSYFDHAPLMGWILALFTNFGTHSSALLVRLPAILLCLGNSYIIYYFMKRSYNAYTAGWSMLLYNVSVYSGFVSGFFLLPDSVQLTFWLLTLFLFQEGIKQKHFSVGLSIKIGITIGLCILSKYHGAALWLGIALYAFARAKWLFTQKNLLISLAISAILSLPILVWNIQHDFISFAFHNNRIGLNSSINWTAFLQFNVGQYLMLNPFIFLLLIYFVILLAKRKILLKPEEEFLIWLALPLIVLPTLSSLFKSTLPHWSGPAFLGIILLLSVHAKLAKARNIFGGLALTLMVVAMVLAPFIINNNLLGLESKNDFTLDMSGWEESAITAKKVFENEGIALNDVVVISPKWFPGGHLNFYWQQHQGIPVLVEGKIHDVHHFDWLPKTVTKNKQLYLYSSERIEFNPNTLNDFDYDDSKDCLYINVTREGKIVNRIELIPLNKKATAK
jgi:hypothetical protein